MANGSLRMSRDPRLIREFVIVCLLFLLPKALSLQLGPLELVMYGTSSLEVMHLRMWLVMIGTALLLGYLLSSSGDSEYLGFTQQRKAGFVFFLLTLLVISVERMAAVRTNLEVARTIPTDAVPDFSHWTTTVGFASFSLDAVADCVLFAYMLIRLEKLFKSAYAAVALTAALWALVSFGQGWLNVLNGAVSHALVGLLFLRFGALMPLLFAALLATSLQFVVSVVTLASWAATP